jgi:P27 family predicted phage terminase small subunit
VPRKTLNKIQKLGPCPPELNAAARAEWDRVVGELIREDRISSLDMAVLAVYCVSFANWREAEELVAKFGAIIKSPNGHPMQSPYVIQANQQRDAMLRCAVELGLTPASRLKFPRRDSIKWGDDIFPPRN